MTVTEKDYWQQLKANYMEWLKTTVINVKGRKGYARSMDLLIEYAVNKNAAEYRAELGYAFVDAEKEKDYKGHTTMDRRRATVRHLNQYLYGDSKWQCAPRNVDKYKTKPVVHPCPMQFIEAYEKFIEKLRRNGLKENTIENYERICKRMLCNFNEQGVDAWSSIGAKNLTTAFKHERNKKYFTVYAKQMFGYLKTINVVSTDYSGVLPQLNKRHYLPSVYTNEEIKQLLESVERNTPKGKRDYLVILLALRLGLRSSDIRLLRFDNVDFVSSTVNFVQFKTSVPHRLSFQTEVADAFRDYIDNGRENSEDSIILLNGHGAPLKEGAPGHIVSRHIKHSGIDVGSRHHGSHSMRMTFASQLVAEHIPYDVVRVALGQVDPNSTRHYVKFDIESLRSCALEVPPPSGRFEQFLAGENHFTFGRT